MSTDQLYFTAKTTIQYVSVMIYFVFSCCHGIALSQTSSQNATTSLHTMDPCENFYLYACTEWERNNPIPSNERDINTFKQVEIATDQYFYNIIANKSYALDDPHLSTTRKFYEACIKGPYDLNDHVRDQLRQLISMAFGEWDLLTSLSTNVTSESNAARNILNLSLTDIYIPLISTTGHSPLFSLDIDRENRAIRISSGQLTSDQSLMKKENEMLKIKALLYLSVYSLNIEVSQYSELYDTFQLFDRLINAFLDPQTSTPFKTNQSVSIEELKAICPPIDWDYLFDKVFNQTGFRNYHKLPIKVEEKHLFQYRCGFHQIQLETDENKSALYNLAVLNFVAEQNRRLLDREIHDFVNKSNPRNSTYFSPYCMNRVKTVFPWTLEKHFLTSHITQDQRNEVQQLVEEVRSSIIESVTQATWLNENTKQFVTDKINQTKVFIFYSNVSGSERREDLSAIYGYPINAEDHVLNEYYAQKAMYSEKLRRRIKKAGKTSLRDSPTYLPEAYYLTNLNRMHIFAGLMQPPFYEKDEDSPTRYIGLGWIIAHEFMHAIDIIGVLEDFNGNQRLGRDSHAGMIANMKQTDCLRSHYKRHPDSFEKSDRIGTRNEILADNGGLKIMYNTYRKSQNRQRVQNTSEILASDRLFFLKLAQTLCGRVHKDSRSYHKNHVDHIVPRYRVIGALSNTEEFAIAYNCPIGSPMNPVKKCKLW
uniref:Neprilysin-2 n=1 Tax=Schistosoma mansoni TaxID=6183 RepID=A0A5K4FAM8_SCHMA